jgi:hypothetical protein
VIYFIQDESINLIKIGFTKEERGDAEGRVADFQTGNGAGLVVLGTMPGDKATERELLARFAFANERGEWFRPVPELIRFIMSVARPTGTAPQATGQTVYTHEAKVKTCSVEIKALAIRGKQVTLSVFRQLQEGCLVNHETGALNGQPWGKVNYFWGDCKPNHLHVVWQKGDELRRDCVFPNWPFDREGMHKRLTTEMLSEIRCAISLIVCFRVLNDDYQWGTDFAFSSKKKEYIEARQMAPVGFGFPELNLFDPPTYSKEIPAIPKSWEVPVSSDWEMDYYKKLRATEANKLIAKYRPYVSESVLSCDGVLAKEEAIKEQVLEMKAALANEREKAAKSREAWRKRYVELQSLDQLFIAM